MGISLNPSALLNGQGLDVSSLVNQILNHKSGQLSQWSSQKTLLETQSGLLTTINNDLTSLASAVTALSDPLGVLNTQAATSSNSGVLTATADPSAAAGSHSIVVGTLASSGLVYTNTVFGGENVSILPSNAMAGNLKLQIGGTSGTTADIQITAGSNDTLTTLAASINQQNAVQNWGITASVITDTTGARLSITSKTTGASSAIVLQNNTTSLTFNPPLGGANASLMIDGVPYSSATNTITGAISGVALNLVSASPGNTIQVLVGPDTSQITNAINSFVNAYNKVISGINEQYLVDPTTHSEGPLGSDSALRTLQSMLLSNVTYSVSGNSGLVNLAALGINMNDDGTLTVGVTPSGQSMSQVLSQNPAACQAFFQNSSSTGFANAFHAQLINLTDPTEGLVNVDLAQNLTQQQNLADMISNFQDQLSAQQKALTNQFSLVNASLQSYPLLLQQVTETLAAMDSSSSTGNGPAHPVLTTGL